MSQLSFEDWNNEYIGSEIIPSMRTKMENKTFYIEKWAGCDVEVTKKYLLSKGLDILNIDAFDCGTSPIYGYWITLV